MSTLDDINQRHTEQVLSMAKRQLPCAFRNSESVEMALDYIQRRMDGRTNGPKPQIRTRVHHRLMQIEHAAELKRFNDFMEWDD